MIASKTLDVPLMPSLRSDQIELYTEDQTRVSVSSVALFATLGVNFIKSTLAQVQTNSNGIRQLKLYHANRDVVSLLVDYISHKPIHLQPLTMWKVLNFAKYYKIDNLAKECFDYIFKSITAINCLKLREFSSVKREETNLISNKIDEFILKNFVKVCQVNSGLLNLDLDHFTRLLNDDHLNVPSESFVWESMVKWIDHDYSHRIAHMPKLLKVFRFGRLPIDYLKTTIRSSQHVKSTLNSEKIIDKMITEYSNTASKESVPRDGYGLMAIPEMRPYRPRVPRSIIVVCGGWCRNLVTRRVEVYDCQTNTWSQILDREIPTKSYHGIEVLDNKLYMIGGTDGSVATRTMCRFDPVKQTSEQLAPMSTNRIYLSTVTLNGMIYALGGHDGMQRLSTCEQYNPKLDTWVNIASMNIIRSDASAVVYKNKIYIVGGLNDLGIERSAEVYDPNIDKWSEIGWMPIERSSFGMVICHDRMYALGGCMGFNERMNLVHYYDFKLECWKEAANMITTRTTFKATVLNDKLYVINGYDGCQTISMSEMYDDENDKWIPVKNTRLSRSGFAAVTLTDLANTEMYTFNGATHNLPLSPPN